MTCCFAIFEELAHYIVQFKYKQIPWNQHSYFSYLKEDIKDLSAMIRILCLLIAALALSVECMSVSPSLVVVEDVGVGGSMDATAWT